MIPDGEKQGGGAFQIIGTLCGELYKMPEPIEMLFGLWAWMRPRNMY